MPGLFHRVACAWKMKPFALQLGYVLVSISAILTDVRAAQQLTLKVFTGYHANWQRAACPDIKPSMT